MKKVISFSLYGDLDKYCLGMLESIEIINEKYSDWEIYIYYNNIPEKILFILKIKKNVKLFECLTKGYKWEGMFWRFYPIENTKIDIFISRDADSRINDREMNLVNNWIESDKCFHIIRDHEGHRIEILGGTFGIKIKDFKKKNPSFQKIDYYKNLFYNRFDKNVEKQPDQIFLGEYIYPLIRNDNMTHICLESLRYSENDIIIPGHPNFVGDTILEPKYKIKEGLLYFHQGWTDIINCLSLINYYCKKYDIISLLIRSEAKEIIDFYTKNIKNIKIIYVPKPELDNINISKLKEDYNIQISDNLFIGGHDNLRNDIYKDKFNLNPMFFVNSFYLNYNIPYITRINDFSFERDCEMEDKVYQDFIRENGNEYILYHEVIKDYDKNKKIVNLNGISTIFFDMIKVLENAIEIHLLDSIWGAFIYQLDAKYKLFENKKIVLYAKRGYSQMFNEPVKLKNWKII